MDQSAAAFESALGLPVLNETALPGELSLSLPVTHGDVAAVQSILETQAGLTFTKAQRLLSALKSRQLSSS